MHEVKSYQMFLYRLEDNLLKITSVERRISMKEGNGLNAANEKRLLKEIIEYAGYKKMGSVTYPSFI